MLSHTAAQGRCIVHPFLPPSPPYPCVPLRSSFTPPYRTYSPPISRLVEDLNGTNGLPAGLDLGVFVFEGGESAGEEKDEGVGKVLDVQRSPDTEPLPDIHRALPLHRAIDKGRDLLAELIDWTSAGTVHQSRREVVYVDDIALRRVCRPVLITSLPLSTRGSRLQEIAFAVHT